ncbi:MAG: sulfatase-like hydrolase/transferase [Chloroflexota bacterium]|nr:sulfatase-like hydrolase/transferase [Chloroflexota bacterium]
MKAIIVMFDTLNRHMLPPYGCDWVRAANFQRLSEKSVTFDTCYITSAPCMPARRDLHTGRPNFLHRSWGPLEPFDDSMPEMLGQQGVYTHLVSDHYHYWETGGATYHTKYTTWEMVRGQEGDPWIGQVKDPEIPDVVVDRSEPMWRQDWVNRQVIQEESQFPQTQVFDRGLAFIQANHQEDNWFLQIETFDPHEPFYAPQEYRDLYPEEYEGAHFDWPPYRPVQETPDEIDHVRREYAALLSLCDNSLGRVLDTMDELDLWNDTMLIVCTDHGFLLGEHDWWAKVVPPFFEEVAHTPLFIWDPRTKDAGTRRQSLVQTIDVAPTVLGFFGIAPSADMTGKDLQQTIAQDVPVREAGLFGIFGSHVTVTDGRYVYMRAPSSPDGQPLNNYTLMPTHMRYPFSVEELRDATLAPPFPFTKGCPLLKIPARGESNSYETGTRLYDLRNDPRQENRLQDSAVEKRMTQQLIRLLRENHAPAEQFERLGLVAQQD